MLCESGKGKHIMEFVMYPIGRVRSSLTDLSQCPNQGTGGAPEAWIEIDPNYADALDGLRPGAEIMILTWMHLADRSILRVHPRKNSENPLTGVFGTRSGDRPNPIGLHRVTVLAVEPPSRLLVKPLEALDGTPVVDIKSVLSEAGYGDLFEHSRDAILIVTRDGIIVDVNPAFSELFGYSREEAIGMNVLLLYWDHSQRPVFKEAIETNGSVKDFEWKALRKDGTIRDCLFSSSVWTGREGEILGYQSIIRDITERKATEAAVREIEERYRQLVENASDMIFQTDATGVFTLVNPVILRLSGYSKEEILGKNYTEMIRPDHREEVLRFYGLQYVKRIPVTYCEFPMITKHGMTVWLGQSTQLLMDGEAVRGFQSIARDITERKEAEDRLNRAYKLQRQLLDTAATGIFMVNSERLITMVNDQFCVITGYEQEDVLGKPCSVICDQKCEGPCYVFQSSPEIITRRQSTMTANNNRTLTVLKNASLFTDEDGNVRWAIESFVDVTELVEAKEDALSADLAKGEFLAKMSHEIRTPMNGIIGMTELLYGTALTPEQKDYLKAVKTSADALLSIINDVLDFSKIESGKLELFLTDFDLRDCVGDTISNLGIQAHKKNLEIAYEVLPEVPSMVVGDPGRLRQVLVNLVGNAIKFTEKGEVIVTLRIDSRTDKDVTLEFAVADTGVGIPPDKCDAVFDAFEQVDSSSTRQYSGTGLGLSICRELVHKMGGRIWVVSKLGEGSIFNFTVRMQISSVPQSRRIPKEKENLKDVRVLVVDDNAVNRSILVHTLAAAGMAPAEADSGHAGLDLLVKAKEEGKPFSLALVDYVMPGMDGFQLVQKINLEHELSLPTIVMLTSGGQRGDAALCQEFGVSGYLIKPVKQTDLLDAIAGVLSRTPSDPAEKVLITRHTLREDRKRLHVLLAEDNPINRKLAVRMLENLGHKVRVAENGKEALSSLEKERFDLILMDVQMPEMDGLQTTRAIREREKTTGGHIPIVAMTAHALKGDRERCLEAGMDGYVSKPFNAKDLSEAIQLQAESSV